MDLDAIAGLVQATHPDAAARLRVLAQQMVMLPSWRDVRKYHLSSCDISFGRHPTVQRDYMHYMTSTTREQRVTQIRERMGARAHLLVPNTFPYWIAPRDDGRPVHHWVFWTVAGHTAAEALELAAGSIDATDIAVLETTAANKSLPEVHHYHVFWCSA